MPTETTRIHAQVTQAAGKLLDWLSLHAPEHKLPGAYGRDFRDGLGRILSAYMLYDSEIGDEQTRRACDAILEIVGADGFRFKAILRGLSEAGEEPNHCPPLPFRWNGNGNFLKSICAELALIAHRGTKPDDKGISEAPQTPPVDDYDVAILDCMMKYHPQTATNAELSQGRGCPSEKIVAERVRRLISNGLASRPIGAKRGATITPEGVRLLESLGT